MNSEVTFNIALEIWGIVICVFAFIALLLEKSQRTGKKGMSICMEIACVLMLVSDSLACYYDGNSSMTGYYMVRICNFAVYFINFIYMGMFTLYLLVSLHDDETKMPARAKMVIALSVLGMLLVVATQFSDKFLYYVDAANVYHRGDGYLLGQIVAVIGIVICFTILIQYRRRVEKAVFIAMLTYFILPFISTVASILHYGMSFQTVSVVMSTQIMFVVDMVEVDRTLVRSRRVFEHARYEADHDSLTGLYNKAAGLSKIREYIGSMTDEDKASLVFLDIDDFKQVNDTYGHAAGDYWIEMVGKLLKSECDAGDVACRFGGDEFVVLHKGIGDAKAMRAKMKRFARKLQLKATERGQEVYCSSGVCQINGVNHDPDECLHIADNALYKAKEKGKHTSVIHNVDQSGTANVEILDRIDSDVAEVQEKLAGRISYMYTLMIYVNLQTGDYRVIKGDENIQAAVENASDYDEVADAVAGRLESRHSRQTIEEFLARARMESQTSDVKSVSYANNEGNASIMHVMLAADGGAGGYFIVVQSLDVYVDK